MKYKVMLSVAAAALFSASASAYDIRLDITGTLTASTCTIDGPRDRAVELPTLSTKSLSYPTAYAGRTPIPLTISGCAGETEAIIYFEPGDTNITTAGNLANLATTGAATNVEVQLLNAGSLDTPLNLNTVPGPSYTLAGTGGEINLVAQYYSALGGATAGSVSTFIEMSMLYQ